MLELPGNASEVLLLHCLRKKGAKSVYILTNRNGNQRRSAIVTFVSEEDKEAAQTKPIRFNNHLLFWQGDTIEREENKRRQQYRKSTTTSNKGEESDVEGYEDKSNIEREKSENNRNKTKHTTHQAKGKEPYSQDQVLLQKILERLERLESRQNKPKEKIWRDLADRS